MNESKWEKKRLQRDLPAACVIGTLWKERELQFHNSKKLNKS